MRECRKEKADLTSVKKVKLNVSEILERRIREKLSLEFFNKVVEFSSLKVDKVMSADEYAKGYKQALLDIFDYVYENFYKNKNKEVKDAKRNEF